jgi:hypothetical protein
MGSELHSRLPWACLLTAVAGFVVGLAIGQLSCARAPGHSRIEWPAQTITVPAPRHL